MNEHMAALLWTVAAERKSFVSCAVPQYAGKTTTLSAILEYVPEGTPVHALSGEIDEMREFASSPDGGYLEVGEISDQKPIRYIWGEPVKVLFETLRTGFSFVTTMHTEGVEDVFTQICAVNDVSDADASTIEYVVHIHRFGDDKENYWRRVNGIYEIRGVEDGVPDAVELFGWRESDDSFVTSNSPELLSTSADVIAERAAQIRRDISNRE
jgi:type IV secretory pathway ATPase VirB11/archaellum biosynthesis ATPase